MINIVGDKVVYKCLLAVSMVFMSLSVGCVPAVVQKETVSPVFFPAAPALPRYQFLKGFNGSEDYAEKESGLNMFLGVANRQGFVLKKPYGVAMAKGTLYVVDTMNSVFKFDLVNKKFLSLPGAKGLGKLVEPINITIDKQENKFVCDPIRAQVIQYDKKDFYVKSFSSPDHWKPVSAAVFEGQLYVVDATKNKGRVLVFDIKSGEIIDVIGRKGAPETLLRIPTNIAFDEEGFLYVVDAGRFQVVKYDRDGHYRGHLGDPGSSFGYFGRPRGVAIDRDGRVYTADAAFDHVQVFTSGGQVLTSFGNIADEKPGSMTMPAGVWIDYDNVELFQEYAAPGFEIEYLVIVSNQFNQVAAVNVYGYGRMSEEKYESDPILRDQKVEELKRKQR